MRLRLFGVTISVSDPDQKKLVGLLPEEGEEEGIMGKKSESTASLDSLLAKPASTFPMKKDGQCLPADKWIRRTHECKRITSTRKTGARKKGVPWMEEEHRAFLRGLEKHGKGDWRAISRHFVLTRTPAQVASHAQKYYLRLSNDSKVKRRTSLFDVRISNNATTQATVPTVVPRGGNINHYFQGKGEGVPCNSSSSERSSTFCEQGIDPNSVAFPRHFQSRVPGTARFRTGNPCMTSRASKFKDLDYHAAGRMGGVQSDCCRI